MEKRSMPDTPPAGNVNPIPGTSSLTAKFQSGAAEGRAGAAFPTAKDIPTSQIKDPGHNPKAPNNPTKNGTHIRKPYETLFKVDRI